MVPTSARHSVQMAGVRERDTRAAKTCGTGVGLAQDDRARIRHVASDGGLHVIGLDRQHLTAGNPGVCTGTGEGLRPASELIVPSAAVEIIVEHATVCEEDRIAGFGPGPLDEGTG